MLKPSDLVTVTFIVLSVGIASAQGSHYPIMEKIAQKILQKDQTASCEQLAQENSQPPTGETAQRGSCSKSVVFLYDRLT